MLTVFLDRFGKENDNLTGDVLREINGNHKRGKNDNVYVYNNGYCFELAGKIDRFSEGD